MLDTKTTIQKKIIDKLDFLYFIFQINLKDPGRKMKKLATEKKYLQITYMIKDFHLKYRKNL